MRSYVLAHKKIKLYELSFNMYYYCTANVTKFRKKINNCRNLAIIGFFENKQNKIV